MSEIKTAYSTSTAQTLDAFKNRACTLDIDNDEFEQPTAAEVRSMRNILGMSQTALARYVGVSYTAKGSNTVRKWETEEGKAEHRPIQKAAWKLMLIKAGLIEI